MIVSRGAPSARGLDKWLFPQHAEFTTHHACRAHPRRGADCAQQGEHRRTHEREHENHDEQRGHGECGVGEAHEHGVHPATDKPRDGANRRAKSNSQDHREQTNRERHASARQQPRQQVAATFISAQRVCGGWAHADDRQIHRVRINAVHCGPDDCHHDQDQERQHREVDAPRTSARHGIADDHAARMRGSISICVTSATMLAMTTPADTTSVTAITSG